MKLLDLFCGAGGSAVGYHRAGFDEIVGVDIEPQPNYPFEFHQADVTQLMFTDKGPPVDHFWSMINVSRFDLIHASPPCHDWSPLVSVTGVDGSRDLLVKTLDRLRAQLTPWVVENTMRAPLPNQATLDGRHGVVLCGTMFGLKVIRHRLFETSMPVSAPQHGSHAGEFYTPAGHGDPNWRQRDAQPHRAGAGYANRCRQAMGIDWMNRDELSQAIPPAYTEWIGSRFLEQVAV